MMMLQSLLKNLRFQWIETNALFSDYRYRYPEY